MFCFAECRAEVERMFARASVEASEVEERAVSGEEGGEEEVDPLEGDIWM